ncbi:MAG: hypothetical protein NXH85_06705 [Pseudomonadaceae bacterium]|nr:hypothetical protein [Pseudomonadaceae bacterium]
MTECIRVGAVMVVALLSVIATELLVGIGIGLMPLSLDITAHTFTLAVLPAVTIVVLVSTLILRKRFSEHYGYGIVYSLTYTIAHALELSAFANPTRDIAIYVAIILTVCAVIIGGSYRLWWQTSASPESAS